MIKNFQELVTQIKTQVPIQELISEFISVKKSGRGYVALCPFHDDHHPSLQIHPQKGIFKCFACGTGGDLITFYALVTKKKWSEVIPELALKYGLKVEYGSESKTETQIKTQLYELNKTALEFYIKNLHSTDGNDSTKYLKEKRNLTDETIEKYKIGYALNKWDSLFIYLAKEKQYPHELIIASGLFIIRENEKGYNDRFRNRIIFPIFNESNYVIGFGGRIIDTKTPEAKYINSPETLIFNKGSNLYGLNFAKDEIKRLDYVILTEGYLDVISAHQHGLLNTVATLGTALTLTQARVLIKQTESKKIYLCMDTDKAGLKAVENIFRVSQEISQFINLDIRVTKDLPGKDLDESLKIETLDAIKTKIENSQKIMTFILDEQIKKYTETNNELDKKSILNELVEVLISIHDKIEQKESIKYASHKLKIDEELLNFKIKDKNRLIKQTIKRFQSKDRKLQEEPFKMHGVERFKHAELELLSLYISLFPYTEEIKNELSQVDFLDEKHKLIKDHLDSITPEGKNPQEIINQLLFEFNEYRHITSCVSDVAWRLETDENGYRTNKNKILKEAKEWIKWWVTNKQKLKSLASKLKESKNNQEEREILIEIMKVVKE